MSSGFMYNVHLEPLKSIRKLEWHKTHTFIFTYAQNSHEFLTTRVVFINMQSNGISIIEVKYMTAYNVTSISLNSLNRNLKQRLLLFHFVIHIYWREGNLMCVLWMGNIIKDLSNRIPELRYENSSVTASLLPLQFRKTNLKIRISVWREKKRAYMHIKCE